MVKYVYDAWGNHKVLNADGTENTDATFVGNINPIRYRSYYYDTETCLYYLQSRYYDPQTGRFISMDDINYLDPETIGGTNFYAYCLNNPLMYFDHKGKFPWLTFALFAIPTLLGAIDGGITAKMSEQNFWKGFAAGAIGGLGAGIITWLLGTKVPRFSIVFARGVSSSLYNVFNELFQTGNFGTDNIGLYAFDVISDMFFSGLTGVSILGSFTSNIVQSIVGGIIDGFADIFQTFLYLTPTAQNRIKNSI